MHVTGVVAGLVAGVGIDLEPGQSRDKGARRI
jgi:hypothetical protein